MCVLQYYLGGHLIKVWEYCGGWDIRHWLHAWPCTLTDGALALGGGLALHGTGRNAI